MVSEQERFTCTLSVCTVALRVLLWAGVHWNTKCTRLPTRTYVADRRVERVGELHIFLVVGSVAELEVVGDIVVADHLWSCRAHVARERHIVSLRTCVVVDRALFV